MGLDATKPVSMGFWQSKFQNSLLSYRDYVENWNFSCSKFTYGTFQKANNKSADQTAQMRRLVCACVVRKPPEDRFSRVEAHIDQEIEGDPYLIVFLLIG